MIRRHTIYGEAVRFVIVGIIATAIHYGIYVALNPHMNVNVAYSIGYFVSLALNYHLSNRFTFKTEASVKKSVGFLICHGINYLLHMVLLNVFLSFSIGKDIAPLFVYMIAIPVNFILVRAVLTSKKKKP